MAKQPESIELYKPWDAKKAEFPGIVSRKLDGVPVRIRKMGGGHCYAYSRQNEIITSIPHIIPYVSRMLLDGGSLVGELYIEGMPFKDISGLVRQKKPSVETGKLTLHLHDFDIRGQPELPYGQRRQDAAGVLTALHQRLGASAVDIPVQIIPGVTVWDVESARSAYELIMQANPGAEGAVFHAVSKDFQPSKRRWTGMKMKPDETIDLLVIGFTEAVDQFGNKKDMVGGVEVEMWQYEPGNPSPVKTYTNVGPGALKHAERKLLWSQYRQGKFKSKIAEVKYMRDDTYEGLRQPTFVRWRDDKSEPDVRQR